ncbi:9467_t:CDS:10, partial [Acaulospora morrowiae]
MQLAPSPVQIHSSLTPAPVLLSTKPQVKVKKTSILPRASALAQPSNQQTENTQQSTKTSLLSQQKRKPKAPNKGTDRLLSPRKASSGDPSNSNRMSPSEVSVNVLDSAQRFHTPSRRLSNVSSASSSSSNLSSTRSRTHSGINSSASSSITNVPDVPDLPSWLQQSKNSTSSGVPSSPNRKSNSSSSKKPKDGKSETTKLLELLDSAQLDQSSTTSSSSTAPRRKSSHKKSKGEPSSSSSTKDSSTETTTSSKQSKKSKYKAATEEALKQFNDLQLVESKIASQTSEVMARMKNLFQNKQPNITKNDESDDDHFGYSLDEEPQSKYTLLGTEKSKIASSVSKRPTGTQPVPIKQPLVRRTSVQDIVKPMTTNNPSIAHLSTSYDPRRRANTLMDGSVLGNLTKPGNWGHNRFASDSAGVGVALTTGARVDVANNKKSLKSSRSEERLRQDKPKSKEKRKNLKTSLETKNLAMEQLEQLVSYNEFTSKRTNNTSSKQFGGSLINLNCDDDDLRAYNRTPSPLLPDVGKPKTMPIAPPPSTLSSRLPPPISLRNMSHSSVEHFSPLSKNIQGMFSKTELDILDTSGSISSVTNANHKRRKSNVNAASTSSPNSPTQLSPKASSRTTTPTIALHRLSHPPPSKDAQPPPPVPSVPPSMLPQPRMMRANDEIPPVPALPVSIMKDLGATNSEKKNVLITSTKNDEFSSRERKDNKSTDGHKKKTRPRGTMTSQQQTDKIIRRQTLPANMAAPAQLAALTLPPFNVPALPPNVKIPTHSNPNIKSKTPTSNLRIPPTTPTSVSSSFSKIPTPTLIQPRTPKFGNRLSSPSGKGLMSSNSKVAPVSPSKQSSDSKSSKGTLHSNSSGTSLPLSGRKSATTPSKSNEKANGQVTRSLSKRQRRLSSTIASIFSSSSKSSNNSSSTSKTPTNNGLSTSSIIGTRKPRTTSQPALISSPVSLKPPSGSSHQMEVDSSSSSASTPSGYNKVSNYPEEDHVTSSEEEISMSPSVALKAYAPYLSLYERTEIMSYPEIYYVGHNASKAAASPELTGCNFGFDDARGDYLVVTGDHLCYRYEIVDSLGKGSFGQVLKCLDHKTGEYVAVKIIRNKKRFHCQALVEVKILENLNNWDPEDSHNIIRMEDHFYFRNHLCIVFELLSMNLYEFIKSNGFQGFSLGLIKRFCVQLLNSLSMLQRHNIVHCDLKPENVLLKHPTKSSIKVIDFGSSCFENEKVYTYIQSRFYRSPEVILGMTYNMAIDMWSLGCILAELYTGYPLFPGEGEQEQLACIMEVQGVPERYLIEKSTRKKLFFEPNGNPRIVTNSKDKRRRPASKTLASVLKCQDEVFLDFISRCLHWDPEKRMKPDEGLMHEWITEVKLSTKNYFTNYDLMRRQSPSLIPPSTSSASSRQNNSSSTRANQIASQSSSYGIQKNYTTSSAAGSIHFTSSSQASTRSNGLKQQYGTSLPISSGRNDGSNIT